MDLMDTFKMEQLLQRMVDRLDAILDKVGDIERKVRVYVEFYLENINGGIGEVQSAIESLDLNK